MIQGFHFEQFARRLRHSAREVVLAATLTLAALVFAIAAFHGAAPETAAVIDPAGNLKSKPN